MPDQNIGFDVGVGRSRDPPDLCRVEHILLVRGFYGGLPRVGGTRDDKAKVEVPLCATFPPHAVSLLENPSLSGTTQPERSLVAA